MADSIPEQCGANVAEMASGDCGYDVTIVCCSTAAHAEYWQTRLDQGYGAVLKPGSTALAVSEHEWGAGAGSGAGNALGTLYAYRQAEIAAEARGLKLTEELNAGAISVAIYHTAGKGTRLAPLPAAENNNKPAVKLPKMLQFDDGLKPISILEAVIRQTAAYAPHRKGRLSVFWGDQVFVPTVPHAYTPSAHVDILAKLGPMPSEAEWEEKGLHRYGLIAVGESGEAAQVEKVTHEEASELLETLGTVTQVGTSLGSFSVSNAFLMKLLETYSRELETKSGAKDTDPHWWMPLTLSADGYLAMMVKKGMPEDVARQDYDRVQAIKASLEGDSLQMFNAVNVGQDCCWWDYGQLHLFRSSMALIRGPSAESGLYRRFLEIDTMVADTDVGETSVDEGSLLQHCRFGAGSIKKTVACNVWADEVQADGAVLINVTAKKIVAPPGSVLYNVHDSSEEGVILENDMACVGVWDEDGDAFLMKTFANEDQKKYWTLKREDTGNPYCFEEIYEKNLDTDVVRVEEQRESRMSSIRNSMAPEESSWCSIA